MANAHHDPHGDTVVHSTEEGHAHLDHPGPMTYVVIGIILAILTAIEVAIIYIPALDPVVVPILVVLSAAKFILVIMFYMHLKMDHAIFTWVFVAPMLLATFLVVALIVLFRVLPQYHG